MTNIPTVMFKYQKSPKGFRLKITSHPFKNRVSSLVFTVSSTVLKSSSQWKLCCSFFHFFKHYQQSLQTYDQFFDFRTFILQAIHTLKSSKVLGRDFDGPFGLCWGGRHLIYIVGVRVANVERNWIYTQIWIIDDLNFTELALKERKKESLSSNWQQGRTSA